MSEISGAEKTRSKGRVTPANVIGQCLWTGRRVIGQLVLLQMLVFTSRGCSKSQSYGASTSMVGSHSASTTAAALPHTSPTSASHKLPCSTKQLGIAGCLNGGSCFTLELHNSSSTVNVAHCSCTSDWSGDRCEYRYIDPTDWSIYEAQKRLKQICIAIGTGTVVLVSVIIISFALYKSKHCRRTNSSTVSRTSITGTINDHEEQTPSLSP